MATIKAFTSLEQSKKLAEILPLESADMRYISFRHRDDTIEWVPQLGTPSKYDFPCWTLAALLGVLPSHFYDKTGRKTLGMDKGDTNYNIFYENKNSYIQKSADNSIDACYEMILELNKLNLL